jgi:hypothetical protein
MSITKGRSNRLDSSFHAAAWPGPVAAPMKASPMMAREILHPGPAVRRHVRLSQHRLFGCSLDQRFQLFTPRSDPSEIVLDL